MSEDSMLTLTTTTGQSKGQSPPAPPYAPFPFPYSDNYDASPIGYPAKYHADNGGAFEIQADDAPGGAGRHLFQAQPLFPAGTGWAQDYDPITSLGATDWSNYNVTISVQVIAPPPEYARKDPDVLRNAPDDKGFLPFFKNGGTPDPIATGVYGGVCVRQIDQFNSGYCFLIGVGLAVSSGSSFMTGPGWVLQAGTGLDRNAGTVLASGKLSSSFDFSAWHVLALSVQGQTLQAFLDGHLVSTFSSTLSGVAPVGLASLRSGFHYSRFDNLTINGPSQGAFDESLFVKHLLWPPALPPGGPVNPAPPRNDFTGLVGCAITVSESAALTVKALGRFAAGYPSASRHTLSIFDALTNVSVASVSIDLSTANGGDLNGYAWGYLPEPVTLLAKRRYYIVSSEAKNGDVFYDLNSTIEKKEGRGGRREGEKEGWSGGGEGLGRRWWGDEHLPTALISHPFPCAHQHGLTQDPTPFSASRRLSTPW